MKINLQTIFFAICMQHVDDSMMWWMSTTPRARICLAVSGKVYSFF